MTRQPEPDHKGPNEFVCFVAKEMPKLPEEFWLVSIVVGVVFGFIWVIGALFRGIFGE
jgi:hypothetical protein